MSLSRKKLEIENRPNNNNNNNTNTNFDSSMVWASPQTKISVIQFLLDGEGHKHDADGGAREGRSMEYHITIVFPAKKNILPRRRNRDRSAVLDQVHPSHAVV